MTASGSLLVKHRSSTSNHIKATSHSLLKRQRRPATLLTPHRCSSIVHIENPTMSKALTRELDLKMQQMKEYGRIARGYHNENVQYPVQVRRSHDGEKVPHSLPIYDKHRTNPLTNTTILIPSSHENQSSLSKKKTSIKKQQLSVEQQQRIFIAPPNKTINDIDPSLDREHLYTTGKSLTRFYSHRKSSSSSSANSSPILCSLRPHSIACLSTTETITPEPCTTTTTDEQQSNLLSNSSQSLLNQSTSRPPIRTITQKFFSKLFHNPSKS